MSFIRKIKILNYKQSGFRPSLSTFHEIKTHTSKPYSALNENKSIKSIFIDLQKAFDTIQPNILPDKMYYTMEFADVLVQILFM